MKLLFIFSAILITFYAPLSAEKTVLRVGHFSNITHAQGVIGHAFSRAKPGWFEKRMNPETEIEWYVYNGGPSIMEALFAGTIDLAYVGPSPTINAYQRSEGKVFQIISGACSGGAGLVVQGDGEIKNPSDFKGRKIATPQFGNTQDIAARSWLKAQGLQFSIMGGDVLVIPTDNPEMINLFKRKEIDAAWTVEPWVSQLIIKGGARLFLDESSLWKETNGRYVTTHLVCSKQLLDKNPDIVKGWLKGQLELTKWIQGNTEEAQRLFNEEMKSETGYQMDEQILQRAWTQIELTHDPIKDSLLKDAKAAFETGFLKKMPDLSSIYSLKLLNELLTELGIDGI